MQRQLTRRVADSDGMLSPDVWRIWLPLFAPDMMVIMLQVSAAGGMRPKAYRVPGVTPTRVEGILMIDQHVVQLDVRMSVEEAESWLRGLPVFVPDLWCVSPDVIGSFGIRPCGSVCTEGAGELGSACESVGAESLEQVWQVSQYQLEIGIDLCAAEFKVEDLHYVWQAECGRAAMSAYSG